MEPVPPKDPQSPLEDVFDLEQRHPPQQPLLRSEPNPGIKFFRFMIWISPGPTCLILLSLGYNFYPLHGAVYLFLAAIITLLIGACDAFLAPGVPKENGTPLLQPLLEHSVKFAFWQILVAPATVIVLAFGLCAVAIVANA
ncbi:hypothetical protein JO972_02835 [Verrucomicrobiaceae bacterium 5K15]|uniref:Transmembrane protein n=1 Tax=Oceaniferula flava TaxID=2800421 RepID=A0AAE2SCR0_9BACT|nr:hypothetical protein [Oceaniferula flavus]MBK1853881.1 hypothetical protein [Oceaniferula flavus]MBM1135187.1 hypothetical protein [Oceaniferula flavus]